MQCRLGKLIRENGDSLPVTGCLQQHQGAGGFPQRTDVKTKALHFTFKLIPNACALFPQQQRCFRELPGSDGTFGQQGIIHRCHSNQPILCDQLLTEIRLMVKFLHYGKVDGGGAQTPLELTALPDMNVHTGGRAGGTKGREPGVHQHPGGEKQPDFQRLGQIARFQLGLHFIKEAKNILCIQHKLFSGRGWKELPIQALKEPDAIVLLHLMDGLRYRGLGHKEPFGGGGHAAGFVDLKKYFQMSGGHV